MIKAFAFLLRMKIIEEMKRTDEEDFGLMI